ncbi:pigmentosa 1-like 1 [Podarcis lilfordi]|uniref:Pigmentosa 1-like 1 n=1 Tax=Podarcis lilfordi TaxID=74358 RepID=A0AA35K496_9SAUR|nr:pigmentosa 1-like 1 [Podarcis lilfordi]
MTQEPADSLSAASPYNYEQPLPPVARTNAFTQVAPAKKITFYKSGDPQFGGVKMAINQRSFKSFNALMDDLSHRVPLPFGVRTITTPRGIHCISTLDQLEDGGCYLCSDKKYVTPISIGPASRRAAPQKVGQPASALRRAAQEIKREDHSAAFAQQSPRIPKKVTLVKNGDVGTRRPIILNRRNARSFKTLLDEISEIMQFTVKKLYTLDGKRIDNMQALLHCPNVLVCVGREPFKPIVVENPRKPSSEKLPGLPSQSNSRGNVGENHEMNFGLKAKKSVIHPRSALSNRSARFSLSSEKSYPNGLVTSPENGAPCLSHCPHSKAGNLVHSLVNDDIEKRVHVNKDGSLSVEMKVRFRLLNDETLQWSTHIQKSSLRGKVSCEEMGIDEDNGTDPAEKENPEVSSEVDDSLYPCDADSYISNLDVSENEEACCHNCGKPCKEYDIWKNPMHASQKEEPWVKNTWYTHSSCSSTSSHRRVVRKKTASVESSRTSSSGEEYSKHVVQESSCYSETVENRVEYRAVQKCRCRHGQSNTSKRGSPVEMHSAACLANSQNEDNSTATAEGTEGNSSRAGSSGSKSSHCSAESQIKVCEESSSVVRTISSRSIKAREEVELEEASCPSSPKSAYSQSIQRTTPETRDDPDEPSEDAQPISSFSVEEEADKEQEETSEVHSALENVASNQSVRDDVSECGRCSTERSFRSKACDGNSQREDSNETQVCSAAASSSSRRSKHSHSHQEADAKVSRVSTIKKKRTKRSLHAEDARSSSRASCYSKSSPEMEGREGECHASHDSSSPRSNVSSLSEAAAPPAGNVESESSSSGHCSQSSKSIQEGGQPDSSSKESSPGSSFSNSNGKNGTDKASRPGSVFESTCSKCGCTAATRNKGLGSIQSIVSSRSESKCTETEASGRSEHAGSQSSVAQPSKPRKKKSSLHSNAERSSQALASESASMYSLHCPAPPKGRPSGKKSRSAVLKKKSNNASATASKEEEEAAHSQPTEMEEENGPGDPSEALQKEAGEAEVEGDEDIIPSSLPNASPEEVVHEWLRKIPSETLLMKCEMQDDGDGTELDAEMPSCSNNQESLGEESEGKKEEEEEEEEEEVAAEEAAEEGAVEDLNDEAASKAVSEEAKAGQAECNHSVISSQNNHKKDLPSTIQTSVQIMKALLASKQEAKLDRSHSLPEVSPTMGRKLSNSANILITCLASLQILDEELDPSSKSSKCLNRPRYTELLNIFQALWFGCASEKGGTSSGLQGEAPEKVPSTFKDRKDGDFTPLSSSGVDVSSGDGGSGEGSVAGARDCALSPEKTNGAKPTKEEVKEEAEEEGGCSEEEEEEHSQPCLKSEGEEKAASTGGEDVTETNENQGSDVGEEEEGDKEVVGEEEMEDIEVEQAEADEADADPVEQTQEDPAIQEVEESPSQENADEADEEPSNNQENGAEAAEEPSDDQENVEAAEEPSDDQENVEEAEEPSDDQENVEAAEEPSDDQENVEEAEEPSNDQENVEVAEEPSDDQENVEAAEEPSDDQENVEEAEEPSDDQENVEAAEEPSDDQENVEVAEEPSDDQENVEVAEEPSDDQENLDEVAEEPSDDQENVEVVEEPSDDQENVEAAEEPSDDQENVEEAEEPSNNQENAEEPSNSQAEPDPNTNKSEPQESVEKQLVDESEADTVSSNIVSRQPTAKASLVTPQKSIDPDPVWVLKLLKKIEKEFMAHYVSAMNDFKVKWNLPNSEELDLMIAQLKEEVSRRIQKSIEKELGKIRSRAGKMVPRPPDEQLRRDSSILQVENRRRRLQSIHKMSLYNDRSKPRETRELDEELDFFSTTIRDDISDPPGEEEYCPCDACFQKKMEAKALWSRGPVVAANAPIVKAFDLQQILRMQRGKAEEDIAEEEAEGEANEAEAEQEVLADVEEVEQEVTEGEAVEAPADGEEENQNCEEAEGEETVNEEVGEEAQEEAMEEGGEGEEEVGEKGEEEVEEEAEEETGEEVEEKGEEEEEEEEEKGEEVEENEEVEEKGEEEEEVDEEKEEEAEEENGEEVEEKGEEEEEVEEEKGEEVEEKGEEEAEEKGEEEEEVDEEKEEEAAEEKGEEEAEEKEEVEEKEEQAEEEKGTEVEENEEEVEEKGEEEEEVEEKGEEEEEENGEEVEEKEEEGEGEGEGEKEGEGREEEEGGEEVEAEEQEEGKEVAMEEEDEEVGAKSEGEGEMNEEEEAVDEEEEEAAEEPKTEDETDGAAADPEAAEGDNKPECAANVDDGEVSEAPAEAEEQPPADGAEEDEGDAKPETEVEEAGENEAEANGEEAEAAEGSEPVQDGGSEDPRETEEGATEGAETQRKSSAFSSMGNCSQQSQKGSEEGSGEEEEDCKELEDGGGGGGGEDGEAEGDTEAKPAKMYPDSEEEEEEEEEGEEEEDQASPQAKKKPKTGKSKGGSSPVPKKEASSEAIDQDDLDF